jgi:hypothetical protein
LAISGHSEIDGRLDIAGELTFEDYPGALLDPQLTLAGSGTSSIRNTAIISRQGVSSARIQNDFNSLLLLEPGVQLQGVGILNRGDIEVGGSNGSVGVNTIGGDFTQTSIGSVGFELFEASPTEYDQLDITGQATLDGGLDIVTLGLFEPSPGDVFEILRANSITGVFDTTAAELPALNGGLNWLIHYTATTVSLEVVAARLPGDYNADGLVNAADYAMWRDGLGTTFTQSDYDVWRANFGATRAAGSILDTAVPEPATYVGVIIALVAVLTAFARRSRTVQRRISEPF